MIEEDQPRGTPGEPDRRDALRRLAELPPGPPHPCPYLPGREASYSAFAARSLDPDLYHELMDRGFRRSGIMFYKPVCDGCRECVPIRVPTALFTPTKSQRRVLRKNADVAVSAGEPDFTDEKATLYAKYLRLHHGRDEPGSASSLRDFLYESPVATLEFEYRLPSEPASDGAAEGVTGRLIGVGICDVSARSLSSVYFYYDPEEGRRSPGTHSAMAEIAFARSHGIPYYYLGFFVRGCPTMNYKNRFGPYELLSQDGRWERVEDGAEAGATTEDGPTGDT
jgi:arginine-tRNA-protein transferase